MLRAVSSREESLQKIIHPGITVHEESEADKAEGDKAAAVKASTANNSALSAAAALMFASLPASALSRAWQCGMRPSKLRVVSTNPNMGSLFELLLLYSLVSCIYTSVSFVGSLARAACLQKVLRPGISVRALHGGMQQLHSIIAVFYEFKEESDSESPNLL